MANESGDTTIVVEGAPPAGDPAQPVVTETIIAVGEAKANAEHAAESVDSLTAKFDAFIAAQAERDAARDAENVALREQLAESQAALLAAAVVDAVGVDADAIVEDDEVEDDAAANVIVVEGDGTQAPPDESGEREHVESDPPPASGGFRSEKKRRFVGINDKK